MPPTSGAFGGELFESTYDDQASGAPIRAPEVSFQEVPARVTGGLLCSARGPRCGELRRSRRLVVDAVAFLCEQ